MNSKRGAVALTLVILVGTACMLAPLERWLNTEIGENAFRSEQLRDSSGAGGAFLLLGGMRSIVASGCWLRTNVAWEKRDLVETMKLINLTVAADERPLYFWLNGARILANDLPEWRMTGPVPAAFRAVVNEEQAQLALRFLEKGLRWRGPDAALYIEMANIHLRRRGNLEEAARFYRLAAEQAGAPYYAARIHAELLRELHRPAEALAWLQQIVGSLPANDELGRRDVVLERIRALELELAAQ